jgi:hypothetical protein
MIKHLIILSIVLSSAAAWADTRLGLPGSVAKFKNLRMNVPMDPSKTVVFNLKEFLGDPILVEDPNSSEIQMRWNFLAETQDVVNKYAEQFVPTTDLTLDGYIEVRFQQPEQCRSFSKVTLNGSPQYVVFGICVENPTIAIPKNFPKQIFINGKIIYDPK